VKYAETDLNLFYDALSRTLENFTACMHVSFITSYRAVNVTQ
jgi:hypothetical protein